MSAVEKIDFVIPHFETDEEELPYAASRPARVGSAEEFVLSAGKVYEQRLAADLNPVDRLEATCLNDDGCAGLLKVELLGKRQPQEPVAVGQVRIGGEAGQQSCSVPLTPLREAPAEALLLRIRFEAESRQQAPLRLSLLPAPRSRQLVMRLFRRQAGRSRAQLEICLNSLARAGVRPAQIHVVAQKQSSAANRNQGFQETVRPYVVFLDDDVEVPPDFSCLPLLAPLEEDRADLAAPCIVNSDGSIFCADPCFDSDWIPRPRGLGEPDRGQYGYVKPSPWLPSTFLLVRREAVVAAGGFSEDFVGSQVEDVDFCLKARAAGFRCLYVGAVRVIHHNLQRNDRHFANSRRFREKWGERLPLLFQAERAHAPTGDTTPLA